MPLIGNIRKQKERRVDCSDCYYCCGRIAITGDFAYLDVEFVKLLYSISRNSKLTCLLDDGKITIVLTMYVNKVDVLINIINPIVTDIIEAEICEKILKCFFVDSLKSGVQSESFKRTVNKTVVAPSDETLIQETHTPLMLLYIAFCFMITEYILNVFVIVGEILAYRINFPFQCIWSENNRLRFVILHYVDSYSRAGVTCHFRRL